MPVLLHAASEHGAVEDIQRGKQGRGGMPLIVVLVWTATDGIDVPE
jgi:hypothetical protein